MVLDRSYPTLEACETNVSLIDATFSFTFTIVSEINASRLSRRSLRNVSYSHYVTILNE